MAIHIIPKCNASKRTRERVKQHGPHFMRCDLGNERPVCLEGELGVYVKAGSWFGWLLKDEIEITILTARQVTRISMQRNNNV